MSACAKTSGRRERLGELEGQLEARSGDVVLPLRTRKRPSCAASVGDVLVRLLPRQRVERRLEPGDGVRRGPSPESISARRAETRAAAVQPFSPRRRAGAARGALACLGGRAPRQAIRPACSCSPPSSERVLGELRGLREVALRLLVRAERGCALAGPREPVAAPSL